MKDKVKLHKEVLAKIDKTIDWYLERKNAVNGIIIIALVIFGSLAYDDKIIPKSEIETDNKLAVSSDTNSSDTVGGEASTSEGMEITAADTTNSEATTADTIKVFIDGEVVSSGVYTLNKDDRIIDLIEKSGGLTKDAYSTGLNMAAFLADGEKVTIYSKSNKPSKSPYDKYDTTVARQGETSSESSNPDKQVNINTATKEELKTLNGVGDVTAAAIIKYREKNGDFASTKAIKNVSGIGDKTFEKFSSNITVK